MERLQADVEAMYAREDAEINRRPLERNEILFAQHCHSLTERTDPCTYTGQLSTTDAAQIATDKPHS